TMTNEKDMNGILLPDKYRKKNWGKILRILNIDELPQLLNVLKGEMSIIGPRPLLPIEMKVMDHECQVRRQRMLPGITGWEAINENESKSFILSLLFGAKY
ncbi:MAG: sugar transferase, partial [Bacteroidales bacterium]|nr:sugar transferase [Bacteroidales bacterium]